LILFRSFPFAFRFRVPPESAGAAKNPSFPVLRRLSAFPRIAGSPARLALRFRPAAAQIPFSGGAKRLPRAEREGLPFDFLPAAEKGLDNPPLL